MFDRFHLRLPLLCGVFVLAALPLFSQPVAQTDPLMDVGPDYDKAQLSRTIIYPEAARARAVEGTVILNVLVGTDGNALETKVMQGVDPLLDSAAVTVGRGMKFTPGRAGGKPVAAWIDVPVDFRVPIGLEIPAGFKMPSPLQEKAPELDEFVAVEQEPQYDRNELSRNMFYPELARRQSIEGQVILRALIDKNGRVVKVVFDQAAHPLLDSAAVTALRKTPFTPAIQGKTPVAVWIQIPLVFRLSDAERASEPSYSREELIAKVMYPESARALNVQGTVIVRVEVGINGEVLATRIDRCDHELLCEAARKAVASLAFQPAMERGRPVSGWVQVPVDFRLQ